MLTEIWSDLRYRARALLRRRALEQELDAELRSHIEREAEAYVRAARRAPTRCAELHSRSAASSA